MKAIAIITGASSGIGKALAIALAEQGFFVLAVARTKSLLQSLKKVNPSKIDILITDISTVNGRIAIIKYLSNNKMVNFLVHCAVEGGPVDQLINVSVKAWQYTHRVNVEAPLFLTQLLIPYLINGRVLFISSSKQTAIGLGCYCISKAALLMLFRCLRQELKFNNIAVGCAMPGQVDTTLITSAIKNYEIKPFQILTTLKILKENNQLLSADIIAGFLVWLLTQTTDKEFSKKIWNINQWIKITQK